MATEERSKGINVGSKHFHILKNEFGVSRGTVYNALNYSRNSYLSRKIREKAKRLLEEELKEIHY